MERNDYQGIKFNDNSPNLWAGELFRQKREQASRELDKDTENAQRTLQQIKAISDDAEKHRAARDTQRATFLLGGMQNMMKNNGYLDSALFGSMSQAFGMPISGGMMITQGPLEGSIAFYSPEEVQDDDGNKRRNNRVSMLLNPVQQYKILNSAKIGSSGVPMLSGLYKWIKNKSNLTDDQLSSQGFRDPAKSYSVSGGTTISGEAYNTLMGHPRRHSTISAYGSDGKGGSTRYYSGPETNWQTVSQDYGTRLEAQKDREMERQRSLVEAKNNMTSPYEKYLMQRGLQEDRLRSQRDLQADRLSSQKEIADIREDSKDKRLKERERAKAEADRQKSERNLIQKNIDECNKRINTIKGATIDGRLSEQQQREVKNLEGVIKELKGKFNAIGREDYGEGAEDAKSSKEEVDTKTHEVGAGERKAYRNMLEGALKKKLAEKKKDKKRRVIVE